MSPRAEAPPAPPVAEPLPCAQGSPRRTGCRPRPHHRSQRDHQHPGHARGRLAVRTQQGADDEDDLKCQMGGEQRPGGDCGLNHVGGTPSGRSTALLDHLRRRGERLRRRRRARAGRPPRRYHAVRASSAAVMGRAGRSALVRVAPWAHWLWWGRPEEGLGVGGSIGHERRKHQEQLDWRDVLPPLARRRPDSLTTDRASSSSDSSQVGRNPTRRDPVHARARTPATGGQQVPPKTCDAHDPR